jgi:MoxR-like ATPase
MENQKTEQKSGRFSTKEVEAVVTNIKGLEIRRKDKYGRLFPNVKGKPAGYISDTNYGISWNANFGLGRETRRIRTKEELIKQVELFGKPVPKHVGIVPQDLKQTEVELVPKPFKYYSRTLAETGTTDVETFEWAMEAGKNVFLIGPTGGGKTALVRYYCAKHKRPYRRVSFNGGCTVEDLVGHYVLKNGQTEWVDGLLTQAVKYGWVLAGDEINAAPAEVLFVLNSVLDDERVLILSSKGGEIIKAHPNFRFVATCNPTEAGYAGTHEMNEALKDRFCDTTFTIDYSKSVERRILKGMGFEKDIVEDIMSFVKRIRKSFAESEIDTPFSTRAIIGLAELIQANKSGLIINRFRDREKETVKDLLDMFIHKSKPVDFGAGDDGTDGDNIPI